MNKKMLDNNIGRRVLTYLKYIAFSSRDDQQLSDLFTETCRNSTI